ncbi:DUF1445 domain-containing protein [Xanthobacter sp. V3C-4]
MTVLLPMTGATVRMACRTGTYKGDTLRVAPDYVQGNVVILPSGFANDFARFCELNPRSCALIARSDPGKHEIPAIAADLDVRSDLPRYRIWRYGSLVEEPLDIRHVWTGDLVTFVLASSHTFEQVLQQAGIAFPPIDPGIVPATYVTDIETAPAGPFQGRVIVSMQPMKTQDAARALALAEAAPDRPGAPFHVGAPEAIGIRQLGRPDYGMRPQLRLDEVPVFWACGVTPHRVLETARLPFAITHKPGCRLVTDVLRDAFAGGSLRLTA